MVYRVYHLWDNNKQDLDKLWKTNASSLDSSETGFKWNYKSPKKKLSPIRSWIIILLPVILFISLAVYFILIDLKALSSILLLKEEINSTSWANDFDYKFIEINETDEVEIPTTEKTSETLIILENEEKFVVEKPSGNETKTFESPKDEFLEVIAPPDLSNSSKLPDGNGSVGNVPNQDESTGKSNKEFLSTTPKILVYSPTIPQIITTRRNNRVDVTTNRYNRSEVPDYNCFSTKLQFCEGILPYDMVQPPILPNIKSYGELAPILPYFQSLIDSNCSLRAKEFICSVLEPECQPYGYKQMFPCKLNCKVVVEDCQDLITDSLSSSKIFDCRRYPDWDESQDCVNLSKGNCRKEEYKCPDGTCIPLNWVCNGVHDCPGSRPSSDEINCQGCSEDEFRCIEDGKCIPSSLKCDGQMNCSDHSDEITC